MIRAICMLLVFLNPLIQIILNCPGIELIQCFTVKYNILSSQIKKPAQSGFCVGPAGHDPATP